MASFSIIWINGNTNSVKNWADLTFQIFYFDWSRYLDTQQLLDTHALSIVRSPNTASRHCSFFQLTSYLQFYKPIYLIPISCNFFQQLDFIS